MIDKEKDTAIREALKGTNLLEEMKKALKGEPSLVTLAPLPEERLKQLQEIHNLGYRFAFSTGMTHEELIKTLKEDNKKREQEEAKSFCYDI